MDFRKHRCCSPSGSVASSAVGFAAEDSKHVISSPGDVESVDPHQNYCNGTEICCQNVWLGAKHSIFQEERNDACESLNLASEGECPQRRTDLLLANRLLQKCRKSGATVSCDETLCLATLLWRQHDAGHTSALMHAVLEVCVRVIEGIEKRIDEKGKERKDEKSRRSHAKCRCCLNCFCCRTRQLTGLLAASTKLCVQLGAPSLSLVVRIVASANRLLVRAARSRQSLACNGGSVDEACFWTCCCGTCDSPFLKAGNCAYWLTQCLCGLSLQLLSAALRQCERSHCRHFVSLLCGKHSQKPSSEDVVSSTTTAETHGAASTSSLELLLSVLGILVAEEKSSWMVSPVSSVGELSPCFKEMHDLFARSFDSKDVSGRWRVSDWLKQQILQTLLCWVTEANAPSLLSVVLSSSSSLESSSVRTLEAEERSLEKSLRGELIADPEDEACSQREAKPPTSKKTQSQQTPTQLWLASLRGIADSQSFAWRRFRSEFGKSLKESYSLRKTLSAETRLQLTSLAFNCVSGVGLLFALPDLARALLLTAFKEAVVNFHEDDISTALSGDTSKGENCPSRDSETKANVCAADAFLLLLEAAQPLLKLPFCAFTTLHALKRKEESQCWCLELEGLRWTSLVASWHRFVRLETEPRLSSFSFALLLVASSVLSDCAAGHAAQRLSI